MIKPKEIYNILEDVIIIVVKIYRTNTMTDRGRDGKYKQGCHRENWQGDR